MATEHQNDLDQQLPSDWILHVLLCFACSRHLKRGQGEEVAVPEVVNPGLSCQRVRGRSLLGQRCRALLGSQPAGWRR